MNENSAEEWAGDEARTEVYRLRLPIDDVERLRQVARRVALERHREVTWGQLVRWAVRHVAREGRPVE